MRAFEQSADEQGSALILAMVFLLITAVLITPLSGIVANAFSSTASLNAAQASAYAASGVTDVAIQAVRYSANSYGALANCLPGSVASLTVTASAPAMVVYCSGTANSESTQSRVVTFSTCLAGTLASKCASDPLVSATVSFNDFSSTNQPLCTTSPLVTTSCGSASH